MAAAPPGSPDGPRRAICLPCTTPLRDDNGTLLRDPLGFPRFHCHRCIARKTDRICECFLCPWLQEI